LLARCTNEEKTVRLTTRRPSQDESALRYVKGGDCETKWNMGEVSNDERFGPF
jgi:hypothetical protein